MKVLPENGELILTSNGGFIQILSQSEPEFDQNCKTIQTMQFEPTQSSWFDSNNWFLSFDLIDKDNSFAVSNYATFHRRSNWNKDFYSIPHSEQIPCFSDSIFFPSNSTYKVLVEQSNLVPELSSLSIGSVLKFNTNQFRSYSQSFTGNLLFDIRNYNHITINEDAKQCRGPECACGNDHPRKMKLICSYVQCPTLPCSDPVHPVGYCCAVCATVFVFESTSTKKLDPLSYLSVRKQLSTIFDSNEDPVGLYLHWLHNGNLQLIATNLADRNRSPPNSKLDQLFYNLQQDRK